MSEPLDWTRVAIEAAISLGSGISGLLIGVWRRGRKSAQAEQAVKDDYESKINHLGAELRSAMAHAAVAADDRLDLLVEQFKESFIGLRRQIDDDRLYTEQNFVRKDDFKDFREEYREDMRELKNRIAEISRTK